MKKLAVQLLLFGYLLIASGCSAYSSDMSGTVVDAETGKPIEGAVVLVEWTKTKGIGLTHTESYKVQEVLTDKEGKFDMSGVSDPFVNAPDITVYKKGYVCWSNRWIFPDRRNRTDFRWGNYVFRLERFKQGYSYNEHTDFITSSINSSINIMAKRKIYDAFRWEDRMASMERNKKTNKSQ